MLNMQTIVIVLSKPINHAIIYPLIQSMVQGERRKVK